MSEERSCARPIANGRNTGSGIYVDVENLRSDGQRLVRALLENWPSVAPEPARLALYVQADLVDDLGLARQVKATGRRMIMADGLGLMQVRMYTGLREIWHGISKSLFATLHYSLPALAAAFLGVAAAFPGPFGFLAAGLWRGETGRVWIGLPVLQIVLVWLASLAVARRLRMSRGMAFLRPLTMVVLMLIAVHSAWCARWGSGTVWKGRSYQAEGEQLTHGWEQAR